MFDKKRYCHSCLFALAFGLSACCGAAQTKEPDTPVAKAPEPAAEAKEPVAKAPEPAAPPEAAKLEGPCMASPEHRQFDFWVGEWDVDTPEGNRAGENIIVQASKGCLILENWTGTKGGTGKSMSFYDPSRKKWRQVWVGSAGGISEFEGVFKDGAMRFESLPGTLKDPNATRRLTFFLLEPDKVRQLSEQTTDGGVTYKTEYDFTYTRRPRKH